MIILRKLETVCFSFYKASELLENYDSIKSELLLFYIFNNILTKYYGYQLELDDIRNLISECISFNINIRDALR